MKTKKTETQPSEPETIDWIEKGFTNALGVEDLWIEIKEKLEHPEDDDRDKGFYADTCPSSADKFFLKHPDGRRVKISREPGRHGTDMIVIEADERRREYDKKAQAKLRRSFVEPKRELLAKEIVRHLWLLLNAFTPIWNERAEVKTRLAEQEKVRHARAIELGKILLQHSKKGRELAVAMPDEPEYEGDDLGTSVRFLLEDTNPKHHELSRGTIEIDEKGANLEIEGPLSASLIAQIADVLSNHIAVKVKCKKKGCDAEPYHTRGLGFASLEWRERGLCDAHTPVEKIPRNKGGLAEEDDDA